MDTDMADLVPELLLPIQVADQQFEGARLQPEKALQLAALTDALRIHRRFGASPSTRTRIDFIEVDEWFAAKDDADGPFSFVGICDSLNLDLAYMRAAVRQTVVASDRRRLFVRRNSGVRTRVVRRRFCKVA